MTRLRLMIWVLLAILGCSAHAHDRNMTGVKVLLNKNDVTVSVIAHLHDLTTKDPATEIAGRLKLRLDGKPFSASKPQLMLDPANGIVIWQAKQQTAATTVAIDAPVFPEKTDQSTVVTVLKDRQVLDEAILDVDHPSTTIGETAERTGTSSVIWRFLREGVTHIFLGPDHVLFLLTLLLLGGSWRQLLKIVTAFTLAHSVTLSLAATGIFSLPSRLVEPVIALSIVAVALTNFKAPKDGEAKARRDFRPWLAFGFGLIHGFGFAGALAEVGLPRESLGWALFAFNGGVELGQATLVLLFAPALAAMVKLWPRLRVPIVQYGSAAVAVVGAFWFAQRLFTV